MMADYGNATAGGYTLEAPCGLVCTSGAATAWWEAGKTWAASTDSLVSKAASKGFPESSWPFEVQASYGATKEIIAFFNESPPWFAFYGEIADWAAKQQTLRDFSSLLGTFLESKGLNPGKGPANAPPPADALGGLVKIAGLGIAAYIAVNLLKAAKD